MSGFLEKFAAFRSSSGDKKLIDVDGKLTVTAAQIASICGTDEQCKLEGHNLINEIERKLASNKDIFKANTAFSQPGSQSADAARAGATDSVLDTKRGLVLLNDDVQKKEFQRAARKIIEGFSPEQQLIELHKLQSQVGNSFALVDPFRRPIDATMLGGKSKLEYDFKDLYYFLSDHFENEMNMNRTAENPFYTPVVYPDDVSLDEVLKVLITESPFSKFLRLYNNYKEHKTQPEARIDQLRGIYKTLLDPNNIENPWYLTKYIENQERPMESYLNEEFTATLQKFAAKYASDPKPIVQKVSIDK